MNTPSTAASSDAVSAGGELRANPVSARWGALIVAIAGALFLLYPAVRPWSDESTLQGAEAMASVAWIVAHLSAIGGFILISLGMRALHGILRSRLASRALVATWIGVGLTLPYYGVEVFGAYVIGQRAVRENDVTLLDMVSAFRFNPAAVTMFVGGLLLLAVGVLLAAVAIWRSGPLPRWSGVPAAVGFALFIPQFYAGAEIRIAHGGLIAAGCAWLAVVLWRSRRNS